MGRIRSAALVLLVLATAVACGSKLPSRVDPPAIGAPAEIGVAYRVSVYCPIAIQLGGLWWAFEEPIEHWPPDITIPPFPFSIWANLSDPYAVPGILVLSSATTATFRADSDGSEFTLTPHDEDPKHGAACL